MKYDKCFFEPSDDSFEDDEQHDTVGIALGTVVGVTAVIVGIIIVWF